MFPSSLHQFLFPLTSTVSRCVFGLAREPDNWLLQRQIRVPLRCRKPLSQLVQHWFHHFPSLWSVCWRHRGDRCSEHEPACEKKKKPTETGENRKSSAYFFPYRFHFNASPATWSLVVCSYKAVLTLAQHHFETRKSSITAGLFGPRTRSGDVSCCSSPVSVHSSTSGSKRTASAGPAPSVRSSVSVCGQAADAPKDMDVHSCPSLASYTLCQRRTAAFGLHVFFTLRSALNQVWWLAVQEYKKTSRSPVDIDWFFTW